MSTRPLMYLLVLLVGLFGVQNASADLADNKQTEQGTHADEPTAYEGWDLVWNDEFAGSELDETKWSRTPRTRSDWANMMADDPDLITFRSGVMTLHGVKNPLVGKGHDDQPYLTAGITSRGKFAFTYGKVEIRARFLSARGAWPALWMLSNDYQESKEQYGEIDIMEHLNFDQKVYQTVHTHYTLRVDKTDTPKRFTTAAIERDRWNTYGLEWDDQHVTFLVNGKQTLKYPNLPDKDETQYPFMKPFFLILSMQVQGKWVGEPVAEDYPAWMQVDYIRVYQKPGEHNFEDAGKEVISED